MKKITSTKFSFTLVEMIVAMGVLSILTFLLFSVLNETSRAITMSSGRTKIYSDLRVVVDQICRDLQQSIVDARYTCFIGKASEMHFVSTIDNNTGNEEVEVGYFFDATSNTLLKTLQFSLRAGTNNPNWDITNSWVTKTTNWAGTPTTGDRTNYTAVLEGVRSVTFKYMSTNDTVSATWISNQVPAYVETSIGICDPQDVIRFRGAANVSSNLIRYFTNIVFLPRQ